MSAFLISTVANTVATCCIQHSTSTTSSALQTLVSLTSPQQVDLVVIDTRYFASCLPIYAKHSSQNEISGRKTLSYILSITITGTSTTSTTNQYHNPLTSQNNSQLHLSIRFTGEVLLFREKQLSWIVVPHVDRHHGHKLSQCLFIYIHPMKSCQ